MHITHYVKTTKTVKQNVESALGLFPAFSFPAFSTPAIFSRIFFSRIFRPCNLVPHFLFLHFPPLRSCAAFSFPAFSISRILSVPLDRPNVNLQLTLLLAYDVFPLILQNLRPSGVLFSKETVCEKFQIACGKSGGDCHRRHIVAPM